MAGLHPGQGIDMRNVTDFAEVSDVVVFGMIVVSGLTYALYLFFYLFRPWFSTSQGRALMTKAVGNVVLIDALALPFALFGDYPFRWLVRLVGMTIFTVGGVYLLVSLVFSPGAKKYPPWRWRR
jgi:hypothetical protein